MIRLTATRSTRVGPGPPMGESSRVWIRLPAGRSSSPTPAMRLKLLARS